jgi:hypothetical protein
VPKCESRSAKKVQNTLNRSIIVSAANSGPFAPDRLDAFLNNYSPSSLSKEDLLNEHYMLAADEPFRIYFAPIGGVPEPSAQIIFVGLTPGLTQVELCAKLYRETDADTRNDPVAFSRLLKSHVAFGGAMRANLCTMLDQLGLQRILNVENCGVLFDAGDTRIATTSALVYPVFVNEDNKNFGGAVDLGVRPIFREMICALLAPRLAAVPEALIIPLGKSAGSGVQYLVNADRLDGDRVLLGLPHPSGKNGHRKKHFAERRGELEKRLRTWAFTS